MALRKFTFLNATEGYTEEQAATDELSLGKVTAVGVSGVAFDASSQRIVGVAAPTAGTDAVNRDYVQAYAAGLDWKQSVRLATAAALPAVTAAGTGIGKTLTADANGALTVDGVAVANGNRVLVKDQAAQDDNGIYVVTDLGSGGSPFVLTRATDCDENAEVTAGVAVFIAEGTANSDTGWVLTTNDPITVDTTNLVFTQFTGTGAIVAGSGIVKSGNTLHVELDTDADAQGAGNGGGSSGLEFDTSGDAGQLRAKVDPAGGIQRLAAGLALEIDDTPNTLDVDADGLKVVGLPSAFLVNDVATTANVSAANLNTLTAGADSDASALHFHSNSVQIWTTSANTDLGDGVYISGNNTVAPGAPSVDAQARIIGVARETVTSPNPVEVVTMGVVAGALSGATANVPYYLGAGGAPVLYAALGGGDRTIRLGFAKNATDLEVRVHDYGKKA
jgi:hypothetical protein